MKIPLASLGLRQKDITAAEAVLKSGQLTMGKKVAEFESAIAQYLGVKHFVMVNSGSSANLIIFEALLRPSNGEPKLRIGDGVLVPAVAWPTTVWPLIQLGLRPVFVDVDSENIGIDLKHAQAIIDKDSGVRAIFPIHPLGFGIDHELLNQFVEKNSIILINDVCESLGSWRGSVHAGTSGLAASFSFYFSHHITTMEGGGVATNDFNFANDLRAMRSHGWSRDRFQPETLPLSEDRSINQEKFQFITTGYNVRPMEIQAAIGIEQLKDLDDFVNRRREIARQIHSSLEGTVFQVIDGGAFSDSETEKAHSWMLICIRILKTLNVGDTLRIEKLLNDYGIESRPVLTGNFLRQPAMKLFHDMPHPELFPNSELIARSYFMVGAHHDLSDDQICYLSDSLRAIASLI